MGTDADMRIGSRNQRAASGLAIRQIREFQSWRVRRIGSHGQQS
jgi:hypothetical protein